MHRELLHPQVLEFGGSGMIAKIRPYQATIVAGEPHTIHVLVRNPGLEARVATVKLVAPEGWQVNETVQQVTLNGREGECVIPFTVISPSGTTVRRARLAADITINGQPWGQQAEALVTVHTPQ
jgi:hypothetical protein